MTRLILVRHGRAAAGWGEDADPGLDDIGRQQAEAVAAELGPIGPMPVIVSPLRRTRETAAPLERQWSVEAQVEPGVGEVVAPVEALAEREAWLGDFMNSTWADAEPELRRWRTSVIDTLTSIKEDSVVVTHFVAINVAVGEALGDARVVCFAPDNCARTVLDVDSDGRFSVVALGGQGATRVL